MIFVVIVLLYLILILACSLPDRLVLFPRTDAIDPEGARQLFIPFQNGRLEVFIADSPGVAAGHPPAAYLLRFWGNGDRADRHVSQEARGFGNHALEEWGVNYPGFGQSTGAARLAKIAPAADAAYEALASVARSNPIYVFGSSLGCTPALHLAATRKVAGIVLHNPPPLAQLIRSPAHGWWNLWLLALPISWQIPGDLDAVANAGRATAPAIFVLSGGDEIIPPPYHQLVVDAYAGPKTVINMPGATHNSPWDAGTRAAVRETLDHLLPR